MSALRAPETSGSSVIMEQLANWMIAVSPPRLRPFWGKLNASGLAARLARGTFWMVFGAAASRILGLVSSILLARLLGQIQFGEFGTLQSTAGLFGTLAGLGIGITATKYTAELREADPERCGRVLGCSLLAAVVGGMVAGLALIVFADPISGRALAAPQLAPQLRIAALFAFCSAVQGAYTGALAGFEAFRQVAAVSTWSSIAGVPLVVLGAAVGGLSGVLWGLTFQAALACGLAHRALLREIRSSRIKISFRRTAYEWSLLWGFGVPSFLSGLLASPAGWFSRAVLVHQPEGYAQAALVNAANQWMNLVNLLPSLMGGVLVPIFTRLYSAGERAKFSQLLHYNLWLNFGVGSAIAASLVLLQSKILALYGAAFVHGSSIFVLTMVAGLLIAFNSLLSRAMQSAGKAWMDLASNAVWASTVIVASWFLVRPFGGFGLVASHSAAALALAIWQFLLLRKLLR